MKKKLKKAQIKIGENVAMMFVFFIIIIFVLVYFYNVSQRSAKIQKLEQAFQKSVFISENAMYLSELYCSIDNTIKPNCVDLRKIKGFYNLTQNSSRAKDYYYDILGFSLITIEVLYPQNINLTVYNNTPERIQSQFATQIPILVLDQTLGPERYYFAIMKTTYYP